MAKPITIRQIAKKANTSIGTVDRVLHNRGRVAEATRKRVLEVAKEGNYTSNLIARHLKLNKTYTLQVILPPKNSYWEMVKDGIERGRHEFEGMGVVIRYYFEKSKDDPPEQKTIPETLQSDADAFIIAPPALHNNEVFLSLLKSGQKPFVFIDSKINNSGYLTYIGQDAYQSGVLAARLIHDTYLPSCHIVILTFGKADLTEPSNLNRIKGFKSYFQEHNITNVHLEETNFERDQVVPEALCRSLSQQPHPVHIFIPNSKSHLLATWLTELKTSQRIRVVGYDLLPQNLDLLRHNTIDYLIHQKPQLQGYLAVQSLYNHFFLKAEIPHHQYMALDIITRENMMYCR